MFLPLAPALALARACGALAVVGSSMTGHTHLGHAHVDVSRASLAFILLLATVWKTDDHRRMFVGSLLAQLIVHGGVPVQPHMLALHAGAAVAAVLLMRHLELLWRVCTAALQPLRRALELTAQSTPISVTQRVTHVEYSPLRSLLIALDGLRRGPPIPA